MNLPVIGSQDDQRPRPQFGVQRFQEALLKGRAEVSEFSCAAFVVGPVMVRNAIYLNPYAHTYIGSPGQPSTRWRIPTHMEAGAAKGLTEFTVRSGIFKKK